MGTHPIFESDFDCLTDRIRSNVHIEYKANSVAICKGAAVR